MTVDQCFMVLCDRKQLKNRRRRVDSLAVPMDAAGMTKGRSADGTPIKGRIRGKSVARELMERKAAREAEERKQRRLERKRNKG